MKAVTPRPTRLLMASRHIAANILFLTLDDDVAFRRLRRKRTTSEVNAPQEDL
jgi:hypothetical protein